MMIGDSIAVRKLCQLAQTAEVVVEATVTMHCAVLSRDASSAELRLQSIAFADGLGKDLVDDRLDEVAWDVIAAALGPLKAQLEDSTGRLLS